MKTSKKVWKIAALLIALGLLSAFVYAVLQARSDDQGQSKPRVLTTFTVLADMARNIAGDKAEVESITKPGAEIHGYEPTPGDMTRLNGASLVLDNGMNLEKWAEKLYQNAPGVPHITLTESIAPMPIAEGPYQGLPNPHAWMSPTSALTYVDNIVKSLVQIDSQNEAYYRQNADQYKAHIRQVDTDLRTELSTLPENNRYLVSCEGAFSYLIRDYDLKELYLWPINSDSQGTPQQIQQVVDIVRTQKIPAVFCESTVSDKAQQQVANETGARFGGVFYVDSLSGADGPTSTYLDLLRYNASTLIKGLKGE